jgi:hypothetical protein
MCCWLVWKNNGGDGVSIRVTAGHCIQSQLAFRRKKDDRDINSLPTACSKFHTSFGYTYLTLLTAEHHLTLAAQHQLPALTRANHLLLLYHHRQLYRVAQPPTPGPYHPAMFDLIIIFGLLLGLAGLGFLAIFGVCVWDCKRTRYRKKSAQNDQNQGGDTAV